MGACAAIYLCVLQNEASSMSKAGIGKLQNLSVTVQRRWNNVLADSTRQLIIEMFLGLRLNQHFPSARFPYNEPLPQQDETDTEGNLYSLVWVCLFDMFANSVAVSIIIIINPHYNVFGRFSET